MVTVRFLEGLRLMGGVKKLNRQEIRIEAWGHTGVPDLSGKDPLAQILIATGEALFVAEGHLTEQRDSQLVFAFRTPPQKVQRRRHRRIKCTMPVLVRSLSAEGFHGSWQQGEGQDISIGGMKVLIPRRSVPPKTVDVRFYLPQAEEEVNSNSGDIELFTDEGSEVLDLGPVGSGRAYSDSGVIFGASSETSPQIEARAQVVFTGVLMDEFALGLNFSQMQARFRLHIADWIGEPIEL
jgi:c-di-GMP-binding flagellar brake protein YcgR